MVNPRRVLTLFAAIAAAACRGEGRVEAQQRSSAPPATRTATSRAIDSTRRTAIVDATARVAPAVVSIRASLRQTVVPSAFDRFFGAQPSEQVREGFGTGFIYKADGVIITNQHVVANAESITVTLPDGTDIDGRVLGEDPVTDIAVVKVTRDKLPVVTIGQSKNLLIGEWAVALGNPYTYLIGNSEPTVTAGVISATGRNILPSGDQVGRYVDMIQTDAAINPGNSGGPLVNALGEVVGVNSSIFSNTGESVGLGFAIPIERASRVADEIIRNGGVRRAWVGLDVAGATNIAEWKSTGGVKVQQVAPDGPAARAGIRAGDVLLSANGRQLRTYLDWEAVKLDLHVGDAVRLNVRSAGKEVEHTLTTGDLPTLSAQQVRVAGLDLVTLNPAIRSQYRATVSQGAAITRLSRDWIDLGLREGDVIYAIGNIPVKSAEDFQRIMDQVPRRANFDLVVERAGTRFSISLQKP